MSQSEPPPQRDDDPELEVFWLTEGPTADGGLDSPKPGPSPRFLLIMAAAIVVVGVLITVIVIQLSGPGESAAGPAAASTAATEPTAPVSTAAGPTATAPVDPPEPTPSSTPTRRPNLTAPPSRKGTDARVYRINDGSKACKDLNRASRYGDYPAARCRFWQPATGRRSGEPIATDQTKVIACQRDLKKKNPKHAKGQSNTWWVWSESDYGTWDWFPETAIEEGSSKKPIRNVAICLR